MNKSKQNPYSQEEREMFKGIILNKIKEENEKLEEIKQDLLDMSECDDPAFKARTQNELRFKLNMATSKIKALSETLKRVQTLEYGRCFCPSCNGDLIDKDRLIKDPNLLNCLNSTTDGKLKPLTGQYYY